MDRCKLFVALLMSVWSASAQSVTENGWPEYGGNLAGQRFSTAKEIDRGNVSTLQVAWTFYTHALETPSPLSNSRASFEATPVLWKGVLYFDTPFNQVFAVDATNGTLRWTFDPAVNREGQIFIVTSRGVSLWHAKHPKPGVCGSDRVLVATLDRRLIARDATTGAACPEFGVHGIVDLSKGVAIEQPGYYGFTSPQTVVGDTVVLGSSVGDNQATFVASGAVRGFDAVTGRQKWSWEPLRHAKQDRSVGSGNAWSVLSADPEHDMVYVPTGSASVDYYGGTRLGDNRDANSLVALRASTGEKVWAFQLVHHDLWDYDTPSEPVLFMFRNRIPAVAVTTKTNMVYVFNRLTGEPLYPVEERPVPKSNLPGEVASPTQPFSTLPALGPLTYTAADIHLRNADAQRYCVAMLNKLENRGPFTPPSIHGSLVYPGSLGGANWGAAAFDPTSAMLYTRVSSLGFIVRELPDHSRGMSLRARIERRILRYVPLWANPNEPQMGREFRTPDSGGEERDESRQDGTPYRLARQAVMTPDEIPCAPEPYGSIVAINLDTGKKVWSVAHGEMAKGEAGSVGVGGVIVTAGGLIFGASTNDAFLRAYDSATGKQLWRGILPVPSNATPMTYSVKGRQFLVIAAGGHGFIGKGQSDTVVAFALPRGKR
jgi:quinoprotein glucose dehydrogenase